MFSSLPPDTALTELPVVRVAEEERNLLISLPVHDMDESAVKTTLQCIADTFVKNGGGTAGEYELSKLSLVRPDGGWFPGIQEIQKDLEDSLKEIEAMKSNRIPTSK